MKWPVISFFHAEILKHLFRTYMKKKQLTILNKKKKIRQYGGITVYREQVWFLAKIKNLFCLF